MQATYDAFVEKAAAGRKTTPERIDGIAQGRVWTGKQAKDLGLVDELGGLDRALQLAKTRAKIVPESDVEIVVYPPKKSFLEVVADPLRRTEGSGAAIGALLGDRECARDRARHGAATAVPPGRAARAHAACFRAVNGFGLRALALGFGIGAHAPPSPLPLEPGAWSPKPD